jgi:hypothetical protein
MFPKRKSHDSMLEERPEKRRGGRRRAAIYIVRRDVQPLISIQDTRRPACPHLIALPLALDPPRTREVEEKNDPIE